MKRHQFISNRKRSGFVLVLTLAMLLIAAMISARTAHRSLSRTLQSIEAESELRTRWEHLSLQRSLLSHADSFFAKTLSQPSTTFFDGRFQLSGHEYRVRLSDECAKLNLNRLRNLLTPEQSQQALTDLTGTTSPIPSNTTPLESWGQLFARLSPREMMNTTTHITLWGDGRLNLIRASDESIRTLLEPVIGASEVSALLRSRHERSASTITTQPHSLVPTKAQELVTEESGCYALWIIDQGSEEARLDVRETSKRSGRLTSFRW